MQAGLTNAVQSVNGDSFKSTSHHGVLFQHLIEMVNRKREESAVGVRSHTGRSSALGEQTDLCMAETQGDKEKLGVRAYKDRRGECTGT